MEIDIFTWCPQVQASEQLVIATLQAQLGDGYKQVASAGINTAVEVWALSCNGNKADMLALRAFLKAHVLTSFWWTNPWGEKHLYRVKPDSINPKFINGNFAEIAFTFEQAFAP